MIWRKTRSVFAAGGESASSRNVVRTAKQFSLTHENGVLPNHAGPKVPRTYEQRGASDRERLESERGATTRKRAIGPRADDEGAKSFETARSFCNKKASLF
ncbi:hypothetical protein BRD01_15275 [Halobacteriales archaeon QS_8_65_32]|nr:MAG: hypothetical protein BRD01_15275 [Halobacteriales archaeon QS_8_65_32]